MPTRFNYYNSMKIPKLRSRGYPWGGVFASDHQSTRADHIQWDESEQERHNMSIIWIQHHASGHGPDGADGPHPTAARTTTSLIIGPVWPAMY